jgi:tRNA U34 2-thiouridine synthase MnmA/TrmU
MKAIALLSGGLDSTLAAKVIKDQGIEVVGAHFHTSFGLKEKDAAGGAIDRVAQAAQNIGIPLTTLDISEDFLALLKKPKHGFGSNMNPCIDCKILMLAKTRQLMSAWGASFVITGEVLGQRPMSQHRRALGIIEKESGLEGLLVRPLSAKLLDETIPEREGWVSRQRLLNFSGRTRKPQTALAKSFNISNYPCSAGGCLLTDIEFSKRLKDLMSREQPTIQGIALLKLGRHFRLADKTRLVVGRNEKENLKLVELAQAGDYLIEPQESAGPTSLGRGEFNQELIDLACRITCFYCDRSPGEETTEIIYKKVPENIVSAATCAALTAQELDKLRL